MRSAIIGAFFAENDVRLRPFVAASTRVTHTDPKAETAALAVARSAAWACGGAWDAASVLKMLASCGDDDEWQQICRRLNEAHTGQETVAEFARSLGLESGVTGYAYHTVPVAIYAWLRHPADYHTALTRALDCGGDTDTVGAIVGGLVGTGVGDTGIPKEWSERLLEWPCNETVLRRLAERLAQQAVQEQPVGALPYFRAGVIPRNLFFLAVVLVHGFRRLLPPY